MIFGVHRPRLTFCVTETLAALWILLSTMQIRLSESLRSMVLWIQSAADMSHEDVFARGRRTPKTFRFAKKLDRSSSIHWLCVRVVSRVLLSSIDPLASCRFIVFSTFERLRQTVHFFRASGFKVVCVLISLAVAKSFHQPSRGISQMKRHRISNRFHGIFLRREVGGKHRIRFRRSRQI